jgi:hypothetical protein
MVARLDTTVDEGDVTQLPSISASGRPVSLSSNMTSEFIAARPGSRVQHQRRTPVRNR